MYGQEPGKPKVSRTYQDKGATVDSISEFEPAESEKKKRTGEKKLECEIWGNDAKVDDKDPTWLSVVRSTVQSPQN